jgi:DNA processing protein
MREAVAASGQLARCLHDADYPERLRHLAGPPAVLFSVGPGCELSDRPAVAVVGARRASDYGLEVARMLGRGLSAAGVTVVSGMAMGVDAAAHEGALAGGADTVAVLGCGADVAYPASRRRLHARLRRDALVVSELPPGFTARRWCFPVRNRVIAALAEVVVVVEGGERSGSLITARLARELGREVGAVPGRITSPAAAGPNSLLFDGAHPIRGAQDVLDLLFGAGVRAVAPARDPGALEPELRDIFEAVASGVDTLHALSRAGRDLTGAMAALAELELRGFVTRGAGGVYLASA